MTSDKADFTQGNILKKLVAFMMPVLGALILQAAYGAVDLLVVGRFGSTSGLSAVSTGSQILNLVTFVVIQFAMGITVLIARYLGEKRPEQIGSVIGGAAVVFTMISIVLFIVMVGFAHPISVLMQAPEEAVALTASYVRICGSGIFFIVAGIAILIDGILILILPFPAREKAVQAKADKKKSGHKISPAAIAAILIGFTSSSTFMLWLNCNQELARSYGMADPSKIQSLYALGTATAILATAAFIKKGLKEINVLILYPLISTIMLALCYFIQAPFICLVGGFVIGYAGAGGVLQLAVSTTAEFFPENKGTATSLVMIASSIANYTILSLAGYITKVGGSSAPRMILLLNMAVTIVGILLALFVKKNRNK